MKKLRYYFSVTEIWGSVEQFMTVCLGSGMAWGEVPTVKMLTEDLTDLVFDSFILIKCTLP